MAKRHVAAEDECISSIAFAYGFFPKTLWGDPSNADLRKSRASPYVLQQGDVVNIPDLRPKTEICATGKKHVFRRKGVPARLRVRLTDALGEPYANLPFSLAVGSEQRDGTTDAEGNVRDSGSEGLEAGRMMRIPCMGTVDLFEAYIYQLLKRVDLRFQFIETSVLQRGGGNIHCATNVIPDLRRFVNLNEPLKKPFFDDDAAKPLPDLHGEYERRWQEAVEKISEHEYDSDDEEEEEEDDDEEQEEHDEKENSRSSDDK